MFIKNWKKEIFTIPNLLSLFRLLLIPIYVTLYRNAGNSLQYYTAGTVAGLSCLTDALDGRIARRYHMVTTLGKILDPLADKATQLTLTLCLSLRYPVLTRVLVLFAVKEGIQLLLGLIHLCRGRILPGALMAGKVCTAVLFASFLILMLLPDIREETVAFIALTDTVFLLISLFSYLLAYLGHGPKLQDLP